jgi:hypothetical protein
MAGAVFIFLHRSEGDDPVRADPISTAGAEGEVTEDAEPVDDQGPADVVATVSSFESEADSLTIAIVPAGVVWVEATADGTRVLYHLLHPGQQRNIDVRGELFLRVGDAGAFQYSINGVPGRQLGGPGTVRTLRITRENYSTFQDQ